MKKADKVAPDDAGYVVWDKKRKVVHRFGDDVGIEAAKHEFDRMGVGYELVRVRGQAVLARMSSPIKIGGSMFGKKEADRGEADADDGHVDSCEPEEEGAASRESLNAQPAQGRFGSNAQASKRSRPKPAANKSAERRRTLRSIRNSVRRIISTGAVGRDTRRRSPKP